MTPILGIYASQISGHLYSPVGSYDAIATVTVPSGGLSSITFAGIPTGYRHLQVRYLAHSTAGGYNGIAGQFNGDTAANYSFHDLYGNGSSAGAASAINTNAARMGFSQDSTSLASSFAIGIVDILDYANTSKYKTTRTLSGFDNNSSTGNAGFIDLNSGSWRSTAAITSITLTGEGSLGNFTQYSQFALYGIR